MPTKKQALKPVFLSMPEKVLSEDDFNLSSLVGLERVLDMVAVLGQLLAIHTDTAAFSAVAKRQGLVLIGGD